MKYRVLGGNHTGIDKVVYNKGDVVESESDLTKAFPGKFALVHETPAPPAPAPVIPAAPAPEGASNPPASSDKPKEDEAPKKAPAVVKGKSRP